MEKKQSLAKYFSTIKEAQEKKKAAEEAAAAAAEAEKEAAAKSTTESGAKIDATKITETAKPAEAKK